MTQKYIYFSIVFRYHEQQKKVCKYYKSILHPYIGSIEKEIGKDNSSGLIKSYLPAEEKHHKNLFSIFGSDSKHIPVIWII